MNYHIDESQDDDIPPISNVAPWKYTLTVCYPFEPFEMIGAGFECSLTGLRWAVPSQAGVEKIFSKHISVA